MAVEVFSSVTAKIDDSFLSSVIASTGREHSAVIEQLLCGMSSNLRCWQNDDGSWLVSGCLNNVVEAGANLLALYVRSQTAARDGNSAAEMPAPTTGFEARPPKIEYIDAEEDGSMVPDDAQNMNMHENAGQSQSGTNAAKMSRSEAGSVGRPRTRQSTRQMAQRQAYTAHKSYCCRICRKSFSSSTNLRRHVRANHETGRFPCHFCSAQFKRCDSLLRHRRTAHADLQCPNCRKVFKNVDSKSSHVCKGRSTNRLSCTVCRKSFISRSNLNKHIRQTHGATVFPCKECGKIFRHTDTLTLHTWKSHHRFICPHCGSVHETATHLCKHMSSVHGKKVKSMSPAMKRSPSPENGDDSMNMNDASDGDDDRDDTYVPDADDGNEIQENHQQISVQENGEASFLDAVVADVCHQQSGTQAVRKTRVRSAGSVTQLPSGTKSCHVCSKSFSSESNLRRHVRVNHEASQFRCHVCSAVFKRIDSLVRHKRSSHADLCCSVCHAVFDTADAKSTHDCRRASEKKLSCDDCGKSFVNRSNLNKHSYLVHGGVKFHCNECPKFFRRSMTLTLHLWKSHNRFTCPQCTLVLDTAVLLCQHMSEVHGRKATKNLSEICRRPASHPITVANCVRCNKTFSSRSNLAKHVRVVHGHPRWNCTMCERSFTSELQLSLHIRSYHQHLPLKSVAAFPLLSVAPN